MSYQVGNACYETAADAGVAACALYEPVSTISGDLVKSVTCYDSNPTTGALYLRLATTDTSLVPPSTTFIVMSHRLSYAPCVEQDYLVAAEIIIGGLLSLYVIWFCGMKIIRWLDWSRGGAHD